MDELLNETPAVDADLDAAAEAVTAPVAETEEPAESALAAAEQTDISETDMTEAEVPGTKVAESEVSEPILKVLPQAEVPRKPRKRRRKKLKKMAKHVLHRVLSHIGEDVRWYFDIRLWSPLIIILLIIALCVPGCSPAEKKGTLEPAVTEPVVIATEPVVIETEPVEPLNPDAVALAKLADSVGANYSDNCKIIVMEVALNRVNAGGVEGYGNGTTLQEEIDRPSQWQGYNPDVEYTESTYQLAKAVVDARDNGGLMHIDSDMLWVNMNLDGSVTVRNRFIGTWTEKTFK